MLRLIFSTWWARLLSQTLLVWLMSFYVLGKCNYDESKHTEENFVFGNLLKPLH
jgi:hypothetical protein